MLVAKEATAGLLAALGERYALVGPTMRGGHAVLAPIEDPRELCLDFQNLTMSAKEWVFPQRQVLYRFRGHEILDEPPREPGVSRVVFGIRPCDARAVTMLDSVFRWKGIRDPYYEDLRARTLLVTLGCTRAGQACFCTSVGGDPTSGEWADVGLIDLGDRYYVQAFSDRGEAVLMQLADHLTPAGVEDARLAEGKAEEARGRVPLLDTGDVRSRLEASFDDEEPWATPAERCIGCGACSHVCPTCHCFDITDETGKEGGVRIRTWDCCTYPGFTAHASGHNPRSARPERMRQRLMHKFSYCDENFGQAFCVGCGRCVVACPVGNDLREAIGQ